MSPALSKEWMEHSVLHGKREIYLQGYAKTATGGAPEFKETREENNRATFNLLLTAA